MDLDLAGKVAVVAGGSGGIGRAAADAFGAEGAAMAIAGRSIDRLEQAATELAEAYGVRVLPVATDLSQPGGPDELVNAALDRFGVVDVLVNAAGSTMRGRIDELTDEDWDTAFGLKFMGAVRAIRSVLPSMRRRGSGAIVNVSGIAGWQPHPYQLTIGSVNAALFNLTRGLAREVAADGVRVNAVAPGATDGERFRKWTRWVAEQRAIGEDEARDVIVSEVPAGRPGAPQEVAAAIAFLASARAAHINGAVLEIDGGEVRGMH
jgi:3-oxoacyl-[acyl-carrier protein] reductase